MRIMIKGGVWKNNEDEILKASVMKYGLNQWSRIASLMNRKSAKQCKARWFEWLDPNIKKTEWTREEDEKLLHLVKLFPMQWRTIAPISGRTPVQCLERYDKLTMMAEKGDAYDPNDDPRRLRPRDIDPNPESNPARPDAVDMDEDEKEMLAEARARLANTKGKKAKRKAREKQMDEARRLAQLQKRRELAMAGIELAARSKSKNVIDLHTEVAFEHKPPLAFYDTSEELARSKSISAGFRPTSLEEIEGKKRKQIEEALRMEDNKRQRLAATKDIFTANQTTRTLEGIKNIEKLKTISLPMPQVSESEWHAVRKLKEGRNNIRDDMNLNSTWKSISVSFKNLTKENEMDSLMTNVKKTKTLISSSTPLTGIVDSVDVSTCDFGGLVPQRRFRQSSNFISTMATPIYENGLTPAIWEKSLTTTHAGTSTPPSTFLSRNPLGLDTSRVIEKTTWMANEAFQTKTPWEPAVKSKQIFSYLPRPVQQVLIIIPTQPTNLSEKQGCTITKQTVPIKTCRKKYKNNTFDLKMRKCSQASQRGFPRPSHRNEIVEKHLPNDNRILQNAEFLINGVLERLLANADCEPYSNNNQYEAFGTSIGELRQSSELILFEAEYLKTTWTQSTTPQTDFSRIWTQCFRTAHKQMKMRDSLKSGMDEVALIQELMNSTRIEMNIRAVQASNLEKTFSAIIHELLMRDENLRSQIKRALAELKEVNIQVTCFKYLRLQETRALSNRVEHLKALIARQWEPKNGFKRFLESH